MILLITITKSEVSHRRFLYSENKTYQRSSSPVYSMAETEQDLGNDSASTVELEVHNSPPPRMTLRSHCKRQANNLNEGTGTDANKGTGDDSSKGTNDDSTKGTDNDKSAAKEADVPEAPEVPDSSKLPPKKRGNKRAAKKTTKGKKSKVVFNLPPQRTIHRDRVDEECRAQNITYKRWTGTTEAKAQLNKSQCDFLDHNDYIPPTQQTPGDCILCPMQKYLKDVWDLKRHYCTKHQENLLVMENVVTLQCKCSDVRSQGWDRDHLSRNAHFHCSVCHWPRDKPSQIRNHLRTIHGKDEHEVQHLKSKPN